MRIPKKLLSSPQRKEMWKDASKIIKKLDKSIKFSEIYSIGSFVSKKRRPADIDFTIVAKIKSKNNPCWPIDIVIVPKSDKTDIYIKDIEKWMKSRYGKVKAIKLK
jgi:hypothetical protein